MQNLNNARKDQKSLIGNGLFDGLFDGLGIEKLLTITFHRSRRVEDRDDAYIQKAFKSVPHSMSSPCRIYRHDKKDGTEYILPMQSKRRDRAHILGFS